MSQWDRGPNGELIVRQIGPGQMALDRESVSGVNGRRYVIDSSTGPEFDTRAGRGLVGSILGGMSGNSEVQA